MELYVLSGFFVLGLLFGSFINVLVHRFPLLVHGRGISVFSGRSHCDHCKKQLSWYELLPIVSFLIQGGICRSCKKSIPLRSVTVELLVGCVFLLLGFALATHAGVNGIPTEDIFLSPLLLGHVLALGIGVFALSAIFFIDLQYYYIPDTLLALFLVAGALESLFRLLLLHEDIRVLLFSIFGILLFFFAIWFFSKGRAMGFGDVKLAPLFPLFLGAREGVFALIFGFWIGALVSLFLIATRKKNLRDAIPLGPFLVLGAFIVLFWPESVEFFLGRLEF